ncbi:ras-specific guanine nucleotide-releasing factor 1-like [Tropilaelaps mercedesae]|uniref:Ras-specific guanine nucleotide-releasing factor 1-like n=1 Tax=Tropilaelaps mercedesae TaxID=418985 RepID=A0A1V9XUC6_9ACAR|nr:ras-specific guanine nucleotide-releasing factor 1-like [Tropilaelaps mercedesae]
MSLSACQQKRFFHLSRHARTKAKSTECFSKMVLQKEELEQKHLHLVQIVESEKTAKWQYTQQCEELTVEIKKLRAETTKESGRRLRGIVPRAPDTVACTPTHPFTHKMSAEERPGGEVGHKGMPFGKGEQAKTSNHLGDGDLKAPTGLDAAVGRGVGWNIP